MKVWKIVLGTFITVAVLSLAYGVANYRAVANERDELQQRLTLTAGILEGKVKDISILQATLDDKNLQIGQLEVSEAGLKKQLGALQTERDGLVEELRKLDLSHKELQRAYGTLQEAHDVLTTANKALQAEHTTLLQEKALLESTILGLRGELETTKGLLASKTIEYETLVREAGQLAEVKKEKEALQLQVSTLQGQRETFTLQVSALRSESGTLQAQVGSLQSQRDSLQGLVGPLQSQVSSLQSQVNSLQPQVGSLTSQVGGLQQQVQSLNGDIARLQAARAPLIVESYRGYFACTGSMEPKITCLDEAQWLTNFRPQDIIVGTVLSFSPSSDCLVHAVRIAHRVVSIKVEGGTTYYRTKGDANSGDDGCWIPSSSVNDYIIALYKNTKLENAPIRDRINALKAASDQAKAVYDAAHQVYEQRKVSYDLKLAAYQTYVTLYCPGNSCPDQYYSTAQSLFVELETLRLAVNAASAANNIALAQYNTAYNSYWAAIEIERLRL